MSPEQATGDRDVDPRSDIYALGCVLYELLAGQPPFAAPTAQAVLARILTEQPRRVTELRRTVPPHIASVLARALEKLPADRFESAQELLEALGDPQFTYETEMVTAPMVPATRLPAATEASRPRAALVPILAAGLVVAVVGAAVGWLRSPPEAAPAPTTRAVLADLPTDAPLGSGERLAISRDGSKLAAISYDEGVRRLYWREVDQFGRTAIPNSEGADDPHFSPDGEWLVFDRDDQIYRSELPSGEIFPVTRGENAHWGTEDMMIFLDGGDLYRVPPMGGDPTLLLEPDVEVVPGGIQRPFLLPDGSGVLFQAGQSDPDTGDRMVFVLDIESGEVADLGLRGANPRYLASGHVVVGRQSQALVAARFDLETLRVVGSPSTVLTGVTVYGGGATQFAASDNGTVFYELGGSTASGRDVLVVEDLEGNRTPTAIGDGRYGDPRWSPDGTSIVYYAVDASGGLPNIFTYNVDLRQAPRQITFEGVNLLPVWSPDGSSVAFMRDAANTDGYDIMVKNLNDTEPPRTLVSLPGDQWPMDWPSDDVLLFASYDDGTSVEALRVTDPTAGDGPASTLYFDSQFELFEARVSPTGDLVAYVSDESGADEVYLRSFPQAGQPERISVDGGRRPQWSADGNTVYFMRLAATGTPSLDLAAADIRRGPPFAVMQRRTVTTSLPVTGDLDLHPQADRLIIETDTEMSVSEEESEPARAVLVTNWFTELERLTGGAR